MGQSEVGLDPDVSEKMRETRPPPTDSAIGMVWRVCSEDGQAFLNMARLEKQWYNITSFQTCKSTSNFGIGRLARLASEV
jgi:hypothetical protein